MLQSYPSRKWCSIYLVEPQHPDLRDCRCYLSPVLTVVNTFHFSILHHPIAFLFFALLCFASLQ